MNTGLDQYMDIFKDAVEDSLLPLIPVTSAKLARRLHISVVFGQDVHSPLNMVSKSWVLDSLILIQKTA